MTFQDMTRAAVNSKYGAPFGRFTGPCYLEVEAGKLYLQRVRLNSGGYDAGGAYWGLGTPLWQAQDRDGNTLIFRAATRYAAKCALRADFEGATFYR